MPTLLTFLLVALAIVAVAFVCNGIFTPRLEAGTTTRGKASAATLLALLIAPAVAAILATSLAPGRTAVYGAGLYFYGGYSVGLVCFIVLNRRFRRITGSP